MPVMILNKLVTFLFSRFMLLTTKILLPTVTLQKDLKPRPIVLTSVSTARPQRFSPNDLTLGCYVVINDHFLRLFL